MSINTPAPKRLSIVGDFTLLFALSIPSFLCVFFGALFAIEGPSNNALTTLEYLDLFGVFFNLLVNLWALIRLIVYNDDVAHLSAKEHRAYASILIIGIVTTITSVIASFCAALTVRSPDVQGHAIAISFIFLSNFWQSFTIWSIAVRTASESLARTAKDWAFRYDLPATTAYLLITIFLFSRLGWKFSTKTDDAALEQLHSFLSGAVALHLSLSAWSFMLDNVALIRQPEISPG
jgi:uncharacterized membrane protein YfcA